MSSVEASSSRSSDFCKNKTKEQINLDLLCVRIENESTSILQTTRRRHPLPRLWRSESSNPEFFPITHLEQFSFISELMQTSIETSELVDVILVDSSNLSLAFFFCWLYIHHGGPGWLLIWFGGFRLLLGSRLACAAADRQIPSARSRANHITIRFVACLSLSLFIIYRTICYVGLRRNLAEKQVCSWLFVGREYGQYWRYPVRRQLTYYIFVTFSTTVFGVSQNKWSVAW